MLAAGLNLQHLLALVGLSLAISYGIVFASGFDPRSSGAARRGVFQRPITETTLAYVVSLAVSLGALYLLHRVGPEDPLYYVVEQTLVLGLPASIGGAAGRVAL